MKRVDALPIDVGSGHWVSGSINGFGIFYQVKIQVLDSEVQAIRITTLLVRINIMDDGNRYDYLIRIKLGLIFRVNYTLIVTTEITSI